MVPLVEDVNRDLTFLTQLVKGSDPIDEMTPLSPKFVPGDNDCICGRGKKNFNHTGNKRFRDIVNSHLQKYSAATTKLEKSLLVSTIVDTVRENSPDGGFVKFDESSGIWHEVGDHLAREKVGQAFRDALHTKYRSSTASKKKKRRAIKAKKTKTCCQIDLSKSKKVITSKIQQLADAVALVDSEENLVEMFNKINSDLMKEMHVMVKLGVPSCDSISIVSACNKTILQVEEPINSTTNFSNDSSSGSINISAPQESIFQLDEPMDFRTDCFNDFSHEMMNNLVPMQCQ